MKPRKGKIDFDPFDGLVEDPFALEGREVRHRSGIDEESNTNDQERRLPRPSTARARFNTKPSGQETDH
jgi:hypothetical protein